MAPELEDPLVVPVPVGGRVLVVSDLLLGRAQAPDLGGAAPESHLVSVLTSWDGAGLVVVAGNLLDLLSEPCGSLAEVLDGHPRLVEALARFSGGPGHRLVVLPGSRDGRLAWDEEMADQLRRRTGAELALSAETVLETGAGPRKVRMDPGRRFDPRFSVGDPTNPAESPLGQHVLTEILPRLARRPAQEGAERLTEPAALARFLVSRALYRGAARHAWWLVIPFAVGLGLKFPIAYLFLRHPARLIASQSWDDRSLLLGLTTLIDLVLVAVALAYAGRRIWAAVSGAALGPPGPAANDTARDAARALITDGWTGLISGHTLQPEMTRLGPGFFAATGAVGEVVGEHPAWLGLPSVFLRRKLVSWIELEAGAELHARLIHGTAGSAGSSLLERLLARSRPPLQLEPSVVASFPSGRDWPGAPDLTARLRRARRIGAVALGLGGLVDLLSALTPPLRARLHDIHRVIPLAVSRDADAVVSLSGLALLFLARGIRGGQRRAWVVAAAVLAVTAVLNVVKGGDLEEAAISLAILVYLLWQRGAFSAAADRTSLRLALQTLLAGAGAVFALSVVALELTLSLGRRSHALPVPSALAAVGGRLVGVRLVSLPRRIDLFLTPALEAITFGVAVGVLYLAFRPVVLREGRPGAEMERARALMRNYGRGTLDYFALRDDKELFFHGSTLVAYGVYGSVCLVSPDPIGPEAERAAAWAAFRQFAYHRGWSLGVLGAGEEWLPLYRASGMRELYVGDEGVLDVRRLDLSGGRHKGLRQAVNRVAKYGYTISFYDPGRLDSETRRSVAAVMTQSRRGDVERGFSMTLGRIFEPRDQGLLLAVAANPEGVPVAFCQYVPAPGINGYSLDLMRRDEGDHPNGLIDFIIVETARYLKEQGMTGLGLNFATMRAVLAGESGEGLGQRVERWVLRRMSDSMQIESLWKFNAKFDPEWQPRYLVYDSPEHLLAVGMAVARAESTWELPVIGRFLVPSADAATSA
jgi:lysylphosphatidylglycerol synthetase-like protein (DUF2156 family)